MMQPCAEFRGREIFFQRGPHMKSFMRVLLQTSAITAVAISSAAAQEVAEEADLYEQLAHLAKHRQIKSSPYSDS